MHNLLIIVLVLLGSTGAAMFFFGNIFALITTAGINQRWGLIALFVPLVSIIFCIMHAEQASYPLKLMGGGLALMLIALALGYGVLPQS